MSPANLLIKSRRGCSWPPLPPAGTGLLSRALRAPCVWPCLTDALPELSPAVGPLQNRLGPAGTGRARRGAAPARPHRAALRGRLGTGTQSPQGRLSPECPAPLRQDVCPRVPGEFQLLEAEAGGGAAAALAQDPPGDREVRKNVKTERRKALAGKRVSQRGFSQVWVAVAFLILKTIRGFSGSELITNIT